MRKTLFLFLLLLSYCMLNAQQPNYLKFTATDGEAKFKFTYAQTKSFDIQYSSDEGGTWNALQKNVNITIPSGQTYWLRGQNNGLSDNNCDFRFEFSGTGNISASGSVMSLVDMNGLSTTIPSARCFASLFSYNSKLIQAPELPATTLTNSCYEAMFTDCGNLSTAPALPATTLTKRCYANMFSNCSSLSTAPALPATTLAEECYVEMFSGCSALISSPTITAPTIEKKSCQSMFIECTALANAGNINANRVEIGGCEAMFQGCTSLVTAPQLSAVTISKLCYQGMFYGCTNLTTAPVLPATELAESCYLNMFYNCSKITWIEVGFNTWNDTQTATSNWLNLAGANGTFVCPASLPTTTRNGSHVPYGWTVQTLPEITFNLNNHGTWDGSDRSDKVISYPAQPILPTVIADEGYQFIEWNTQADGLGESIGSTGQSTKKFTVNTTVYAIYTQEIVLTFDLNNHGAWNDDSRTPLVIKSSTPTVTLPNVKADVQWLFTGWNSKIDGTGINFGRGGESYTFTDSDTAYAQYVNKHFTVSNAVSTGSLSFLTPEIAPSVVMEVKSSGVLTISETETALTFDSIIICAGGKVVIPSGNKGAAKVFVMQGGDSVGSAYYFRYPQLVVNGTLNVTNDVIYYDYLLNKKQQYPLCLPVDVNIADITYADGAAASYGTAYKVASYDGGARAAGATGWGYLPNTETVLHAGKGYTIFAAPQYYPYGGAGGSLVQSTYSRLRFPLAIGANFTEAGKTISVTAHDAGKPNDAGWNLVGNPYFANYENVGGLTGDNGIHMLTIKSDGTYEWTGTLRYVVIPTDNGKAYSSVVASSANIPAFKNYFVQIGSGDAIQMVIGNRAQSVAARFMTPVEEIMTGVVLSNVSSSDKLGVLIGEYYTDNYEINADLQKFGHNAGVNVYAYMQKSELAFVAVNELYAKNAISVGFIAPRAGEYTFAIDESYDTNDFKQVLLYDSETKTTTNLLNESYAFTAPQGMNNTRFSLSIRKINNTATTLDKVVQTREDGKYIFDGKLLIKQNGQVYNAQGAQMK